MGRLSESLSRFPEGHGSVPLHQAIELFPMAAARLENPNYQAVQISHANQACLPSAADIMVTGGGATAVKAAMDFEALWVPEAKVKQHTYEWGITNACSDSPMCGPEIGKFLKELDLEDTNYANARIEGLTGVQTLQIVDSLVYLTKHDPNVVFVKTSLPGYKKRRKSKFNRYLSPLPSPSNPRERTLVDA